MTTAVEADSRQLGRGILKLTLRLGLGGNLESLVQVGDVRLMVLVVVQLHDLLGDAGLQSLFKSHGQ